MADPHTSETRNPTGSGEAVFHAHSVCKIYIMGEVQVHALRSVTLDLFEGEFVVLLGPSGSGKSTLLNILGALDVPTSGEVYYRDHVLTKANDAELTRFRREHVGFVFQFYNLIPSLTALENVAVVTEISDHPLSAEDALAMVGLTERMNHFPAQLSGVGHPSQLEIVSDVLSNEAVKVKPGDPVLLENWGGETALHAEVRTVESSGFTKISALGVEEQRVNIVMDFVDPPGRLADAYRADIRIIVWEGKDVLKVPTSALFRRGQQWSVFAIEGGRARVRDVQVGHRNALEAEVLSGLSEDTRVILHPGNLISDGTRVSNPN